MADDSTTMGAFAAGNLTEVELEHVGICHAVGGMMCQSPFSRCHRLQLISEGGMEQDLNVAIQDASDAGFLSIWTEGDVPKDSDPDDPPEEGPWIRLTHPKGHDLVKKAWPDYDWDLLT